MKLFVYVLICFYPACLHWGQDLKQFGTIRTLSKNGIELFYESLENANMEFCMPAGFKKYDSFSKSEGSLFFGKVGLISKDKNCIVIVHEHRTYMKEDSIRQTQGVYEKPQVWNIVSGDTVINGIISGRDFKRNSPNLRHRYYIHPYEEDIIYYPFEQAKRRFNADSLMKITFPLEKRMKAIESLNENYLYEQSLIIQKNDRGYIVVDYYLTSKGRKKRDKYIQLLKHMVWYKDE